MHCALCEKKINETLKEEVPGVLKSEVKTKKSGGIVTIDPARTSSAKVIEAINRLGYEAKECRSL
ncbi:MAG: heavy-metal-associated domain-containing protein [Deltaproteobacteria bacterium]|nr:heavy-metal-associated domain-containing protein [Deltaproteobacteria bacterium]